MQFIYRQTSDLICCRCLIYGIYLAIISILQYIYLVFGFFFLQILVFLFVLLLNFIVSIGIESDQEVLGIAKVI